MRTLWQNFTNRDVIQGWSSASPEVVASFGEEGDVTRRYLLNPAIFALSAQWRESASWMPAVVKATSLDSWPTKERWLPASSPQTHGTPML